MPKISIALAGRNDRYGGQWLKKLRKSIKYIQIALEGIDYEILLLDYNPPKDRPLLSECFSIKKYPRINHVIFSKQDHLEYINHHYKNKCKLIINNKIIPEEEIKKRDFFISFAFNMAIKKCSGDYILSTGTDNIFPIQFNDFVNRLEKNIIYRSPSYLLYCSRKININNIGFKSILKNINNKDRKKKHYGRKNNIFRASGNFILMDKNSWEEIGGYLPTINPRSYSEDSQILFHGLCLGKKIKSTDFYFLNLDFKINNFYKKIDINPSNYIISKNNLQYNHKKEIGEVPEKGGCKEWKRYREWAKNKILKSNKEYYLKIKYKNRFKEIQKLFKSILPSKFLVN